MHKSKKQRAKEKHVLMAGKEALKTLNSRYNSKHIIARNEYVVFIKQPKLRARNILKCRNLKSVQKRIQCTMMEISIKDYTIFHDIRKGRIMKIMKGDYDGDFRR